jgi:hypothetical protein
MSTLVSGFPTYFNTPSTDVYMSQGRETFRRDGISANRASVMFQARKAFAVYKTKPKPKYVTSHIDGWEAGAVDTSIQAAIAEVGLLGTDAINAQETFRATTAEIGLLGVDKCCRSRVLRCHL